MNVPGPKTNPIGRLEKEIRSLTGRLSKSSGSTETLINAINAQLSALASKVTLINAINAQLSALASKVRDIEAATKHTVSGMDIYIQQKEPDVSGDYVWIDTDGIDLIKE